MGITEVIARVSWKRASTYRIESVSVAKIFVSSSYRDLIPERRALREGLESLYELRNMEDFGSTGLPSIDTCLAALRECDASVTVIGYEYGSIVPTLEVSYTEAEYECAQAHGIPIFAYIKHDFDSGVEASSQSDEDKRRLRRFLATVESDVTVRRPYFANPRDLADSAIRDLERWLNMGTARPAFQRVPFEIKDQLAYASETVRRAESRLLAPHVVLVDLSSVGLRKSPGSAAGRLSRKILQIEEDLKNEGLTVIIFTQIPAPNDSEGVLEQRLQRLNAAPASVVVFFARDEDDIDTLEEFSGGDLTRFVWYRDHPPTDTAFDIHQTNRWVGEELSSCQVAIDVKTSVMQYISHRVVASLGGS